MQKIRLTNKLLRRLPKNAVCNVFYFDSAQHLSIGDVIIVNQYNKANHTGHITQVYSKMVCQLTQDEVSKGGYLNVQDLTYELAMRYTRFIRDDDILTIVMLKVDNLDATQKSTEPEISEPAISKLDLAV